MEEKFHRAAPRGMGGTKAAGNYSPVLVTQLAAKAKGFAGERRGRFVSRGAGRGAPQRSLLEAARGVCAAAGAALTTQAQSIELEV